jgi:two-component system, NarL family, nitrate/nitrite response regulator NarL
VVPERDFVPDRHFRIVLCDDHDLFLESLAYVLRSHGHEVWETRSPREAVLATERFHPDVCVLDIGFPEGTGVDAAMEIIGGAGRTEILFLSAVDDPDVVSAALAVGARGFLRKDQAVGRLLEAMEAAVSGRTIDRPTAVQRPRVPQVDGSAVRRLEHLTPRESDVLAALVAAETTQEIADHLGIAPSTARSHVQSVLDKLGVHSRIQAVALAAKAGFDVEA